MTTNDQASTGSVPRGHAVAYTEPDAQSNSPSTRWALLVGINSYIDKAFAPLRFCVDDVLALEKILTKLKYTVVMLYDNALDEELHPTRENVEAALAKICQAAQPGDLIWMHFSGHGVLADEKALLITREIREPTMAKRALPVAEVLSLSLVQLQALLGKGR